MTELKNTIGKSEIENAVKKMINSPYPVGGPEIKIFFSPTLRDKKKAKIWFNKNWEKLVIEKTNNLFDAIMVKENENYKIWNPKKPFKGKNPKYNCIGFDEELIKYNNFLNKKRGLN